MSRSFGLLLISLLAAALIAALVYVNGPGVDRRKADAADRALEQVGQIQSVLDDRNALVDQIYGDQPNG